MLTPVRRSEMHQHAHKGVTDTPRADRLRLSGRGVLLAQKNRVEGAQRWYGGMGRLTVHCCTSHLVTRGCESALTTTVAALSHTQPSEQTHPQDSRYTPRCPSVVLWTPCSGVEWRVCSNRHKPTCGVAQGTPRAKPTCGVAQGTGTNPRVGWRRVPAARRGGRWLRPRRA
jgi:hypothetical protein